MADFFAELKRRHVYRVGAAYTVVAWVLLQLFNNVAPILEAPPWVARVLLLILVLGFPIALLLAWTFEATLAGIKRETPGAAGASVPLRHSRLDWALMAALVAVLAAVTYQQLVPSRATVAASPQAGVEAARVAAGSPSGVSVAVLPFVNLSDDRAQEFFSDGMTDEVAGVLAKVPDLRVVARSSAFSFKGQNQEARAVGQALGATHLIEGSVRKAGTRVRITAQLVQADNGLQLWTETYDRELSDVFAIQEEIARAIATSLHMPLGLRPGESLVNNRTRDVASYDEFLRAKVLWRAREVEPATAVLEQVVGRDPGFAPAWALLGQSYASFANFSPAFRSGSVEERRVLLLATDAKAERAAREAIRLDARNALAYAVLARLQSRSRNYAAAEDLYKQALTFDPAEPEALNNFTLFRLTTGHFSEAVGVARTVRALEPLLLSYGRNLAQAVIQDGQTEAGIAILEPLPVDAAGGYFRNENLAQAYAAKGRYVEAADTLLAIPQPSVVSRQVVEDAARLLRTAPAKVRTPGELPDLDALSFVYAYIGAEERLMDFPERQYTLEAPTSRFWWPAYAVARKTERFKKHVRDIGLVDYWRERGWPDLCRPMGADDFVCD
jgi:TolB-like protein